MMVNVRKADIYDIDEIVRLRIELLKEIGKIKDDFDISFFENETKKYLVNKLNKGYMCWVAEENGEIVASGGLIIFEKPPAADNITGLEGYIMNIYTIPQFRRNGIATTIMNEIINYLKEIGIKKIRLHASKGGRPVYEKLGFDSNNSEMILEL